MPILTEPAINQTQRADLVIVDEKNNYLVVVEVKAASHEVVRGYALDQLTRVALSARAPFAMLADRDRITLWRVHNDKHPVLESVISLETQTTLAPYSGGADLKSIRVFYLETLIRVWLEDLLYHWKGKTPSGEKELEEAGFLSFVRERLGD